MNSKYPEHEKLQAVKEQTQKVGEFIEWLNEHGYSICERYRGVYWPTMKRLPNALLAEFFEIDETKLDDEKRAMLDECRAVNAK